MDKNTVFNMALSLIGGGEYTADAAHTKVCELWYPLVLSESACRCNWTFSRRKTTLSPNPDGSYTLPPDCMNILYLRSEGEKLVDMLVVDRLVYADVTGDLSLVYTSSSIAELNELPDSAPEFCTGVAYLLAARVARKVTGDMQVADICEQRAEMQFQKALLRDSQQEASNKLQSPFAFKLNRR